MMEEVEPAEPKGVLVVGKENAVLVKDVPVEKGKFYEFKVRGVRKPIFGKVDDVGFIITEIMLYLGSKGIRVQPWYKRRGEWTWAFKYKVFPIGIVEEVRGGWESPEEYEQIKLLKKYGEED